MLTIILLLILKLLTLLVTWLIHSLSTGLTLMNNTIFKSLTMITLSEFPWPFYVLFLVFIGCVLVLFTYVNSLASNQMFRLNIKTMIIPPITIIMNIMIVMLDLLLIASSNPLQNTLQALTEQQKIILMKFQSKSMATITLTLAAYLFIALIAVVKVTI